LGQQGADAALDIAGLIAGWHDDRDERATPAAGRGARPHRDGQAADAVQQPGDQGAGQQA
jgi:hypothetical protein